jgi:hypothetical protein
MKKQLGSRKNAFKKGAGGGAETPPQQVIINSEALQQV